jgi:hypothetical protein
VILNLRDLLLRKDSLIWLLRGYLIVKVHSVVLVIKFRDEFSSGLPLKECLKVYALKKFVA